ncbi:hypothetical protein CPB84DRAFT_1747667 [Gymnopilus junonius]|uniref:Uncharacterized protein n=1 Tax=Gymnopilus junonius TaxID=109634 RepID=A0A9P5NNU6_GYMJU|nr:hypothetical protein CPB84DRAFT_1747667 [Gymnopilus junonius]
MDDANHIKRGHATHAWTDDEFSEYIHRVRAELIQQRDNFLFWDSVKNSAVLSGGGEIWYGEPSYYVKLIGGSGTLASDILLVKSDLPRYNCDLEILGNDVRETVQKAMAGEEGVDPDLEDCSEEVAKLPLVAFNAENHFIKRPTYKQEIRYLLQCQGSPFIVQLLKFKQSLIMAVLFNTANERIKNIKLWMLDIIDGVAYLSYVFALGALFWECCFYNHPHNRHVLLDNPPPPPFRDIFVACTRERLEDRPTHLQLRAMYEAI